MNKRKNYRLTGKWLDGSEFKTVVYPTMARAKLALHSFRNVALLDAASLVIEEVAA